MARAPAMAACALLMMMGFAYAQTISSGCNANSVPGDVRSLTLVPTPNGKRLRINWKPPQGANSPASCVSSYTVEVFETSGGKMVAPSIQTTDHSAVVTDLKGNTEYTVTVAANNNKGQGPKSKQTITLTPPDPCNSKAPAAIKNLAAEGVSHNTIEVAWGPGDACYASAEVVVVSASTGKEVYRTKTDDVYAKIQGLSAINDYKVTVTPLGKGGERGPSSGTQTSTLCNAVDAPGGARGLTAKATNPAGSVDLIIGGITNNVCVAAWEIVARGSGKPTTETIQPYNANTGAATYKFRGEPNKVYNFAVTPLTRTRQRGTTANIGPVKADGRTVLEAGPRRRV